MQSDVSLCAVTAIHVFEGVVSVVLGDGRDERVSCTWDDLEQQALRSGFVQVRRGCCVQPFSVKEAFANRVELHNGRFFVVSRHCRKTLRKLFKLKRNEEDK